MKSEKRFNNKGYTLVELIVTILITGMIVTMIMVFISVSRNSFDAVKKEAVLQQEAQMAGSYIGDIAIEASECSKGSFTIISDIGVNNYKVLNIKAPDPDYVSGTRYDYYFIILWEESTQILRFCKVKDDAVLQPDGTYTIPDGSSLVFEAGTDTLDYEAMLSSDGLDIIGNPKALLAKYVTDIDVILPDLATNKRLTQITFHLRYRDKEYILTKNVAGRNLD
ncbi:MAG: hypothetical protein K0S01_2094 [Herbinix sp.]|jgi:prepilin-type N-terminal cleavage/methylation domain-containing protein|nr:hypothetical protein [Herbinix sp.]